MGKIIKNAIASLLFSASLVAVPSMCEKRSYAVGDAGYGTEISYEFPKTNTEFFGYRRLSDSKNLRNITKNKIPKNVRNTIQEIVSYAGEKDTLYVPIYSLNLRGVPPTHCSRYSRFAAEDLFNLDYKKDSLSDGVDAWNLRYHNKIIETSDNFSKDNLEELVSEEIIQPGMIVGFYNPKSKYKNGKDEKGKKRLYTHVGVYLGQGEDGEMKFAHQWGSKTQVNNLHWFYGKKLIPKEILDAPKETN